MKLKSLYLWFWQIRNQLCRRAYGLPSGRIRRPYPIGDHKEDTGSIPNDKRVAVLVEQPETEQFLDRNKRIWYRISLRGNNGHE